MFFLFFKQKTAYEMRISDWTSDVCSSDLRLSGPQTHAVNMLSNTMTSLGQLPEHALAAVVGKARTALQRDADVAARIVMSEVGAHSTGLPHGQKKGRREFSRASRTGEASDFVPAP